MKKHILLLRFENFRLRCLLYTLQTIHAWIKLCRAIWRRAQ